MNVLFLSQIVPYPPHGGVLQRGYNLVRELARHAKVHLLAFVHPDVLPTEAAISESRTELERFCSAVEYFPLWAKASSAHKLAAAGLSAVSPTPFSFVAHRSPAYAARVRELLAAGKFDVVHVDTLALAQFVDPAGPLPTLLTHHNIESGLMGRRAEVETGALMKRFLRRETAKLQRAERTWAPRFDVNIFMSDRDEQVLRGMVAGIRTAVVPNGVDTTYFTGDRGGETASLIYTGGMNMFANRDAVMYFLAEIWPLVRDRHEQVTFYAVGQDPPPELRAVAERDRRVVVTGFVDDIRPYVSKAAVYVVPLRVGGGTRLKVLDAMSMGKAMVSTSIGCEGIDVEPGKHLLVADQPRAFADAVLTLLGDAGRRAELSAAARRRVEELYAWPVVGGQLIKAYEAAVANRVTP